jgi:hypothetical protein
LKHAKGDLSRRSQQQYEEIDVGNADEIAGKLDYVMLGMKSVGLISIFMSTHKTLEC